MSNPLDTQVGGDHYKNLKIQPIEFSMANGWDACAHSILKYVVRYRSKDGVKDLQKAYHFTELRIKLTEGHKPVTKPVVVDMMDFISANGISGHEAVILCDLEDFQVTNMEFMGRRVRMAIAHLIHLKTKGE